MLGFDNGVELQSKIWKGAMVVGISRRGEEEWWEHGGGGGLLFRDVNILMYSLIITCYINVLDFVGLKQH